MLWKAEGGCVGIGDTDLDYVSFGTGKKVLVMLPGLGDGLTTVKGMAVTMAFLYRIYARDYRVYVFSRKNRLNKGETTRDMAADQAQAMKMLGISGADVLGISQGGMIAQYLAIDHPQMVGRLVLAVTLARQNETVRAAVSGWMAFARQGDYQALLVDTAEKSYSERYLKKYRPLYPLLGKIGKPKDFTRFLIQAESCLGHDAYEELGRIACPVLVIGGDSDKIVGSAAAGELAGRIRGSELLVYEGLGHGAYEEAPDFHEKVLEWMGR